jgi:hypothetical protein
MLIPCGTENSRELNTEVRERPAEGFFQSLWLIPDISLEFSTIRG